MTTYKYVAHKLKCRITGYEEVAHMYPYPTEMYAVPLAAVKQNSIVLLRQCSICKLPTLHDEANL